MAKKSKTTIKSEIETKKKLVNTDKFSGGSLKELQDSIKDIYEKLNDINERT